MDITLTIEDIVHSIFKKHYSWPEKPICKHITKVDLHEREESVFIIIFDKKSHCPGTFTKSYRKDFFDIINGIFSYVDLPVVNTISIGYGDNINNFNIVKCFNGYGGTSPPLNWRYNNNYDLADFIDGATIN
jgi:hypothetical protein